MEFQLYTVTLEDRNPKGLVLEQEEEERWDKSRVANPSFLATEESATVPKTKEHGCCAFLFGRGADGRSVCVKTQGVELRLYFLLEPGESLTALKHVLQQEVAGSLRDEAGMLQELCVTETVFCHFYYLEPDPASPSGRRQHRYAQVSYPSIRSWRAACALRSNAEIPRAEARLQAALERGASAKDVECYKNHLSDLKKERMERELERKEKGQPPLPALPKPPLCREAQEAFVDPTTQFLQAHDLVPAKWYRIPDGRAFKTQHKDTDCVVRLTSCDVEVELDTARDLVPCPERSLPAPYVTAYLDIETMGLDPEQYPCIQVGLVFSQQGKPLQKHLVGLGSIDPIAEDVHVHACSTERQVLEKSRELLLLQDPDFVVAYNGVNFDNPYLDVRAAKTGAEVFHYLSRFLFQRCKLREQALVSAGTGDNLLKYFDMPGRSNLDWYIKLQRDLPSEPSYALDHFAKLICNDHKDELAMGLRWKEVMSEQVEVDELLPLQDPPDALVRALASGGKGTTFTHAEWHAFQVKDLGARAVVVDPQSGRCFVPCDTKHHAIAPMQQGCAEDRARLGKYCVQDVVLLDSLEKARTMITQILQFCTVFFIQPEAVYFRGMQLRFLSQLLRKARVAEAVPLLLQKPPEGWLGQGMRGYEGATVVEPESGFHTYVACLDWLSLYPSLQISYNLCHSTCIQDPELFHAPGVVEHRISEDFVVHFSTTHMGIMPRILEELGEERSKAKKKMKEHAKLAKKAKEAGDAEEAAKQTQLAQVFDGQQLAIKMSRNSMYGASGARVGVYPCLGVSAATTYRGRDAMVIKRRILAEKYPGIQIVYGDTDSVMIKFANVEDSLECARLADEAANFVTHHFQKVLGLRAMELEFEKIFKRFLLQRKKRYAALMEVPDGEGGLFCKGVDAKGLETERKDTLPYVKEILREVLDALVRDGDEQRAFQVFCDKMDALVKGEVPLAKLVLRKKLSSKVVHKTDTIAHAKVNALRKQREPGSEASTNESVDYVIITGHPKSKTTDLAEDPTYAREHGLKPNLKWYFEHCIRDAVGKNLAVCKNLDFAGACERYAAKLEGMRLGVNSNALMAMLKPQGAPGSSSSTSGHPLPSSLAKRLPPPEVSTKKKPKK